MDAVACAGRRLVAFNSVRGAYPLRLEAVERHESLTPQRGRWAAAASLAALSKL